jgi:hypothetical protein
MTSFVVRSSLCAALLLSPIAPALSHEHKPGGAEHHNSSPSPKDAAAHNHGQLVIPSGQTAPTLKLMVYPDRKRGWNLELKTTQFTFAPERVNQGNSTREGHAHLMINGESVTRLYGNWYYIKTLKPGRNTLSVNLASNSHNSLVHNGRPIADTVVIDVPMP